MARTIFLAICSVACLLPVVSSTSTKFLCTITSSSTSTLGGSASTSSSSLACTEPPSAAPLLSCSISSSASHLPTPRHPDTTASLKSSTSCTDQDHPVTHVASGCSSVLRTMVLPGHSSSSSSYSAKIDTSNSCSITATAVANKSELWKREYDADSHCKVSSSIAGKDAPKITSVFCSTMSVVSESPTSRFNTEATTNCSTLAMPGGKEISTFCSILSAVKKKDASVSMTSSITVNCTTSVQSSSSHGVEKDQSRTLCSIDFTSPASKGAFHQLMSMHKDLLRVGFLTPFTTAA